MRQAAHALRDLSERLLEAHQMPETQHQPYLLLCASSLDADTAWQFADVIDKAGTVPVTLIAPARYRGRATSLRRRSSTPRCSTPQQLDSAGTDITVQRLEHAAYVQITTALKVSAQPRPPGRGPVAGRPGRARQREPARADRIQKPPPPRPMLARAPWRRQRQT